MKLSFMVPGFSKCGSTTLCSFLAEHPDLFIPALKEPMYFILNSDEMDWESYCELFATAESHQKLGEGSTFYTAHQHDKAARDRIIEHNPDIKLIFIARDPLKRIESSYREFHHSGSTFAVNTPYSLDRAMVELPALIEDSRYWARLSCYREQVPDSQILVVFLEELKADPRRVLRQCYQFLDVDPDFINSSATRQLNSGEHKFYDSKLLRWLRNQPLTARRISSMPLIRQDRIFKLLGLRRPFGAKTHLTDNARITIQRLLRNDVFQFLSYAGKSIDLWPETRALLQSDVSAASTFRPK